MSVTLFGLPEEVSLLDIRNLVCDIDENVTTVMSGNDEGLVGTLDFGDVTLAQRAVERVNGLKVKGKLITAQVNRDTGLCGKSGVSAKRKRTGLSQRKPNGNVIGCKLGLPTGTSHVLDTNRNDIVVISGINKKATKENIRSFLQKYGNIVELAFVDASVEVKSATVVMDSAESACDVASNVHGQLFMGKRLLCSNARSRKSTHETAFTIYGLPVGDDIHGWLKEFISFHGRIRSEIVWEDDTRTRSQIAFMVMEDSDCANLLARNLHGLVVQQHVLICRTEPVYRH